MLLQRDKDIVYIWTLRSMFLLKVFIIAFTFYFLLFQSRSFKGCPCCGSPYHAYPCPPIAWQLPTHAIQIVPMYSKNVTLPIILSIISHPCPLKTHGHGWAWVWAPNVGYGLQSPLSNGLPFHAFQPLSKAVGIVELVSSLAFRGHHVFLGLGKITSPGRFILKL